MTITREQVLHVAKLVASIADQLQDALFERVGCRCSEDHIANDRNYLSFNHCGRSTKSASTTARGGAPRPPAHEQARRLRVASPRGSG